MSFQEYIILIQDFNNYTVLCIIHFVPYLQPFGLWFRIPGALGLADWHGIHCDGQPWPDDVRGAAAASLQG